jgi:hypothetical protein
MLLCHAFYSDLSLGDVACTTSNKIFSVLGFFLRWRFEKRRLMLLFYYLQKKQAGEWVGSVYVPFGKLP